MLGIPHCLWNGITDGGEVVGLTRQRPSIPQKHFLLLISVTGRINSKVSVMEGLFKLENTSEQ
jgi:hypothetical protein